MGPLVQELKSRWQAMFAALASGDDVSPGERLRGEGMMEAAVIAGEASEIELDAVMSDVYLAAFGRAIDEDFRTDWRNFYPFPQIPAMAKRAPVFPSTSD